VKQAIVDAAGGDPRFIGSHPMAGSEMAGVSAAKADLFDDATWALTPTGTTSRATLGLVRAFAQGVGGNVRVLPADLHDQAVAVTSHLPHLLAFALSAFAAERAGGNPDLPYLSAGSWSSATRVAASLPSLWADIASANQQSLSIALEEYRTRLDRMQAAIDTGDWTALEQLFQAGHSAKRRWPGR
jgi:prephenate dehydrogenase